MKHKELMEKQAKQLEEGERVLAENMEAQTKGKELLSRLDRTKEG